jgi:hypothetical protein
MKNPFLLFVMFGLCTIILYSLGFSELYQELSIETITYLVVILLLNLVLGVAISSKIRRLTKAIRQVKPKLIPRPLIYCFLCLIFIDFMYAGIIPVFEIFNPYFSVDSNIKFIPMIHTILVIFSVFITQYFIHCFFLSKNRNFLLLAICFGLVYPLLLVGRGILFVNIFASFIAILFHFDIKFRLKTFGITAVLILLLALIFGKIGEIRSSNSQVAQSLNSSQTLIAQISQPSDTFYELGLNTNFLWPYIYVTSPLGNLDNLFKHRKSFERNTYNYIVTNYTPNFLQKYMLDETVGKDKSNLVVDVFNTYGAFGKSYQQYGWLGLIIYFSYVCIVNFLLVYFSKPLLSNVIMIQFIAVGHTFSWFSNLYVKEIIIGPVMIGMIFLIVYFVFPRTIQQK